MPPPAASHQGAPMIQSRAGPEIAALQASVAAWLRAETGRTPDVAAMIAGGYENLRPACRPEAESREELMHDPFATPGKSGFLTRLYRHRWAAGPDAGAGASDRFRTRRRDRALAALRDRPAGGVRADRGALQVRLDRRRARVRFSGLDLQGDAGRLLASPSRRLGLARLRVRGRQGGADRHVDAQLPGHRPHVLQLRCLPCRHGPRRSGCQAAARAGHAGEYLQPARFHEVRVRLRARSEVRGRVRRSRNRPIDERRRERNSACSIAMSSIRSPSR